MSNSLDMSLDDLIKMNKKQPPNHRGRGVRGGGGGGGGGRGHSLGPSRRGGAFKRTRPPSNLMSRQFSKAPETTWQHDLFDQDMADAGPSKLIKLETGTKVVISNLDYGVSNDDLKELFSEVGDLKRHTVHYDRSGRSKGTGEVVFARRIDAENAVRQYDNVQLDGKPLRLEIAGTNLSSTAPSNLPNLPKGNWPMRNPGRPAIRGRGRGTGGPPRGRGGRGRGGRQGGGKRPETKSVEDLDAELENYHAEAMQTN